MGYFKIKTLYYRSFRFEQPEHQAEGSRDEISKERIEKVAYTLLFG